MDELISDRAKYLALALLGLASIGGAFLLTDGPAVESLPAPAAQIAKPGKADQPVSDMASAPEADADPVPAASPAPAPVSAPEGAAQDDDWGESQ